MITTLCRGQCAKAGLIYLATPLPCDFSSLGPAPASPLLQLPVRVAVDLLRLDASHMVLAAHQEAITLGCPLHKAHGVVGILCVPELPICHAPLHSAT